MIPIRSIERVQVHHLARVIIKRLFLHMFFVHCVVEIGQLPIHDLRLIGIIFFEVVSFLIKLEQTLLNLFLLFLLKRWWGKF